MLKLIAETDRSTSDFLSKPPLVIDCTADRKAFYSRVTERQRDYILSDFECGKVKYVSDLVLPAYLYAKDQFKARYRDFDANAVHEVRKFLDDWRCRVRQNNLVDCKIDEPTWSYGIALYLPLNGVCVEYDEASLMGL